MDILTEADAKRIAMQKAVANGHDMRPWQRHRAAHFRNRSSCKCCGQELLVISEILDHEQAQNMKAQGVMIGRFDSPTATDVDFTYASGGALLRCSRA